MTEAVCFNCDNSMTTLLYHNIESLVGVDASWKTVEDSEDFEVQVCPYCEAVDPLDPTLFPWLPWKL